MAALIKLVSKMNIVKIDSDRINDSAATMFDATFHFGSEVERCRLPIGYWNLGDYIDQWKFAINKLLDTSTSVMLITSVYDPATVGNIIAWLFYDLSNDTIAVQQHLLLHEKYIVNRNLVQYELIPERETVSSDGEMVSEWTIQRMDLTQTMNYLISFNNGMR